MEWPKFTRTRIAPTPSGYLHIGNILSFAWTAYLAKMTQAQLLLRIDDLDSPRIRTEYVQDVFNTLEWMGIAWTEGPQSMFDYKHHYSQTQRIAYYQSLWQMGLEKGLFYACSCSRKTLQTQQDTCVESCQNQPAMPDKEDLVNWRFKNLCAQSITLKHFDRCAHAYGLPEEMQGFVVRRKNQLPSYQLASLADDVRFEVDLVVRGEDLWSSTLAQAQLAHHLGLSSFAQTHFVHHPLLKDELGRKLSKSAGAKAVALWRQQGMTRQELYRHLSRLNGCKEEAENWEDFGACLMEVPAFRQSLS